MNVDVMAPACGSTSMAGARAGRQRDAAAADGGAVHGGPGPLTTRTSSGLRRAHGACSGGLPGSAWARTVRLGEADAWSFEHRGRRPHLLRRGRDRQTGRPRALDGRTGRPALRRAPPRACGRDRCSVGIRTVGHAAPGRRIPPRRGRRGRGDRGAQLRRRAGARRGVGSRLLGVRPMPAGCRAKDSHAPEPRAQLARDGADPPARHRRSAQPGRLSDARLGRRARPGRHRSPRPRRSSEPCPRESPSSKSSTVLATSRGWTLPNATGR